jgi:hypothetical protein
VGYTFCAFALASIVLEFVRGPAQDMRSAARRGWAPSPRSSAGNRAGTAAMVHVSIVLLAIGIVGSSAYDDRDA